MKKTISKMVLIKEVGLCSFFCLLLSLGGPHSARAFEPGKTYDKSNYQEIEDLLAYPILHSVKNGEYIIKTGELGFEIKICDKYMKLSEKNKGRFDFMPDGNMIEKSTQEQPPYFLGLPFPEIDTNDPKVALKIMENFYINLRCRFGGNDSAGQVMWIGQGGLERELVSVGKYFSYQGNPRGNIPNPNNFRSQSLTYIAEPFDVRGVVAMNWEYEGNKESVSFSYLPMLRRLVRVSATARSDPFMGSDACTDDAYGYNGKNADMEFKYLGLKTMLMPMSTDKLMRSPYDAEGGIIRQYPEQRRVGFMVGNWQGAPYAPVDTIWVLRPVYLLEMFPKNPYYNYGRQILYIDKNEYFIFIKEIYDRAGEYWKRVILAASFHLFPDEQESLLGDYYPTTDDKTQHCTFSVVYNPNPGKAQWNPPLDRIGPQAFTTSNVIQMTK